jgi:hypothetical protein
MPAVKARIEYLQKLPLYDTVKPYWCFLPPRDGFDPDEQRLDNLEWEDHSDISIEDIRDRKNQFRLDNCGFEVFDHETQFTKFELAEEVVQYKHETEEFLKDKMGAVHVRCYDSRLRKNVLFQRNQLDLNDLLVKEGPARGVHNGESWEPTSTPVIHLPELIRICTRHYYFIWPRSYSTIFVRGGEAEFLKTWLSN